jgi:hypothetical protein
MAAQNGSGLTAAATVSEPREFGSYEHLLNSNTDLRSRDQSQLSAFVPWCALLSGGAS